MGNIIELKDVDKIYTGFVDTQVLFNINLSFEDGSCNSIVGESGSGKSTLLNIISTLDKPTRGEVLIDGIRTDNMSKNKLSDLRNEKRSKLPEPKVGGKKKNSFPFLERCMNMVFTFHGDEPFSFLRF